MRSAPSAFATFVLFPVLWAVLGMVSTADAQPRGQNVSQFQEAAEERRIEAPDADEPATRTSTTVSANPENMEEALYLRERADNLGEAAREFQDEQLAALLESRVQLVAARRVEAIRLLEEFIGDEPEDAAEMPDALLRLAELKWELARANYIQTFGAWQAVPEENRGPAPSPDYAEAIGLYDRILERHRDFDRYDLVLYMKAYGLIEKGQMEDALALYQRILEEFPESRFVPDAYFALAESQFNGAYDYQAALDGYDNVLRYPESGLYDVALFKSAWCLWRLNRSQDAAERFRMVLDLGQNRENLTSAQRRRLEELQDEALSYLIQVFTEDENNTAQDVFDFLEEIGGERYAHRVIRRLSETYVGQARYEAGIEAFELLLEMDPMSPDAPNYQREIAAAYASMGQDENTTEALRVLASTYGRRSAWARNQGDPETVRRARELTERQIRRQALMWHEEGQRENQNRRLEQAAALYVTYLRHYPRSAQAYQINYYIGEIYFHRLERFSEAGDAYLAAARLNPQGELSRDALYNAIGAFERVREQELADCAGDGGSRRRGRRGRRGRQTEAEPQGPDTEPAEDAGTGAAPVDATRCGESANDRKFGSAIELYVELFPNDPDLPEILFRQGRLYYDRGVYDPAIRLWGQLIDRFPSSEYAEPAGELILDSFNRADDYANIETWARRLKGPPAFSSQASQTRLNGLILQSVFALGEQLAEGGSHREAADAYFRAAEEFPTDDRARQAYYNAGVERQRGGDLTGAAAAYDRLIERYAGTDEGAQGARTAAQMYESIAQFSDAARYYEAYSDGFPRGEHVQDSLYNAVLLRVTAGDYSQAVEDGNNFLRRFPRSERKNDVYFFIGRAHEEAEDWDEAASTYRNFIRSTRNLDLKVEATTRL
ncbi:MAG: tetratricopeptide repeat protein, partial [Deltaproteobacteria bacterium]|nr:tetratricopeptide repeat protein [Deltaproteobacteria bacterium]